MTRTHVERCRQSRRSWVGKTAKLGDWYISGNPLQLWIMAQSEAGIPTCSSREVASVPDTHSLIEHIDSQLAARRIDTSPGSLTVAFSLSDQWAAVDYGDAASAAVHHESEHSAPNCVLFQIAGSPAGGPGERNCVH